MIHTSSTEPKYHSRNNDPCNCVLEWTIAASQASFLVEEKALRIRICLFQRKYTSKTPSPTQPGPWSTVKYNRPRGIWKETVISSTEKKPAPICTNYIECSPIWFFFFFSFLLFCVYPSHACKSRVQCYPFERTKQGWMIQHNFLCNLYDNRYTYKHIWLLRNWWRRRKCYPLQNRNCKFFFEFSRVQSLRHRHRDILKRQRVYIKSSKLNKCCDGKHPRPKCQTSPSVSVTSNAH